LVSFLAAFQASRAHDTIYAILGLASDFRPAHPSGSSPRRHNTDPEPAIRRAETIQHTTYITTVSPFEVDYKLPVLAVFKNFLDCTIKKSKSLDIICRPWAPNKSVDEKGRKERLDLPSWIPTLSRKPFQQTRTGNMVRYSPDPLVGPAVFRHRIYGASGSKDAEYEIELEDPKSKRMIVKGFVLDTVEEVWDCAAFGNVPSSWLITAGNWENKEDVPPEELWRTLVADRNEKGDDPDRWYPLVFQSAAKERGLEYGFETYKLIYESGNSTVSEVFRRVQAVVWSRRLIRGNGQYMNWLTQGKRSDGALGLGPSDTRPGDLICIIFGCSVPLILRKADADARKGQKRSYSIALGPQDLPSAPNGSTVSGVTAQPPAANGSSSAISSSKPVVDLKEPYTLVGECYIDRMMDGAAIAYMEQKQKENPEKPVCVNFILE
jgi:hypothetical protein